MEKKIISGYVFIIFLILSSGCQIIPEKEKKVEEGSIKEKIIKLIGTEESKEEVKIPEISKTTPETSKIIQEMPKIPKITPPIEETVKKNLEKKEYPEEIIEENLSPIPESVKFINPSEINQEMAEIFKNIYFDYDSYEIKKEYIEILKKIGDYLVKKPEILVLIEGHCDERGTREYNLVLGEQRALSVRNFLINLGVSPKRLFTVSYGEDKPAVIGNNENAWAKNRRCEFKIGMEKK
jgi:peptidoglycan-associated lipoprotein